MTAGNTGPHRESQSKPRLHSLRTEVSAMFLLKCCVAGNAFPMKSTKLVSLMAAALGASIVLAPSDAKAVAISFNLQGSPVGNNSINNPTNTILTVGAGTTITAATPSEYLALLQAGIAGFTGTFNTAADIFGTSPTAITFSPNPYNGPDGSSINWGPANTTGYNSLFQATGVVGWAFTVSGGSFPAGTTGTFDLSFLNQGAGSSSFSWTGTGTLNVPDPVPGPLPLLGAGAAFGWTRRLRKRLATGSRQG